MNIPRLIQIHIKAINKLCKKHKVSSLSVFGSVLTEKFNEQSDLDFLVTFGKINTMNYADNYFDFKESLEALFMRKVDLIESQTLKNHYFKSIVENSKLLIYAGRQSVQMAS
jgi:uncharacterized protein